MTRPLRPHAPRTAIGRVMALPLVGALAGCGFASGLPEAPANVDYDLSAKPPSVAGPRGELPKLPAPQLDAPAPSKGDEALAKLGGGVEYRAPAEANEVAALPAPAADVAGAFDDRAFAPLEFEGRTPSRPGAARTDTAQAGGYQVPPAPVRQAALPAPSVPSQPLATPLQPVPAPLAVETVPYETVALPPLGTQPVVATPIAPIQPAPVPYADVPVESYALGARPSYEPVRMAPVVEPEERRATTSGISPVAVLRARMSNGAVIEIHPVIGAPGAASATLARTVVMGVGTPINAQAAANAPAVFQLKGRAARGEAAAEWTLVDSRGSTVGVFPERASGADWASVDDEALRGMGRRVADRIARNGALRRATLTAAAQAPTYATAPVQAAPVPAPMARTFVLERGASLAEAPMPRPSPRIRVAEVQPAPVQPAPMIVPPAPVRPAPRVVSAPAPLPVPVVPEPVAPVETVVAPAPLPIVEPPVSIAAPRVAPPPAFDTLEPVRAAVPAADPAPMVVSSGPRPLVFGGVSGAPGDGDEALSREVTRLLANSGAPLTSTPTPDALMLTAQVTKTDLGQADRIRIVWTVSDGAGESIGTATQENDLPDGLLDRAWGENAGFAAQGAMEGIMELLQTTGAMPS